MNNIEIAKKLGMSIENYTEAVQEQEALQELETLLKAHDIKYYIDDERVIISFGTEDIKIIGFKNALKVVKEMLSRS